MNKTTVATLVLAGSLACGLSGVVATAATPAKPAAKTMDYDPHSFTGVWMQHGGGRFGVYPFTPEFQAISDKRKQMTKDGNPYQPAGGSCLPRGLVGMLTTGAYPLEFLQTPNEMVVIKENGGTLRIHMGRKHLVEDDLTPLFYGDSIGHWEGDFFVVDSISLGATDNIDGQNPHSDVMHVVTKFHRTGLNTMEVELAVDDAKALSHTITTKAMFTREPDYEMQEYYCVNERNVNDGKSQTIAGAK